MKCHGYRRNGAARLPLYHHELLALLGVNQLLLQPTAAMLQLHDHRPYSSREAVSSCLECVAFMGTVYV